MAPPRAPTSRAEVDWEGGERTVEEAAVRYRYYIAVFGGVQACSWVVRHQITFVLRRSIPVIAFFICSGRNFLIVF